MTIYGVTCKFGIGFPIVDLDLKLDKLHDFLTAYTSDFYSVDIAASDVDLNRPKFSVLIGVKVPEALDPESFAKGVTEDALTAGFKSAGLGNLPRQDDEVTDMEVLAFA